MDPNVAYRELNEAMRCGDWDMASEYWEALNEWLSKDGFLPEQWSRSFESRRLDGPPCAACGTFHPSCE